MPNWVENQIRITGPDADVQEFVRKAKQPYLIHNFRWMVDDGKISHLQESRLRESALSYWNFVCPKEGEPYSDYFNEDQKLIQPWYDWNILHWGTKWDAAEVNVFVTSVDVVYRFLSPWNPPEQAFAAMVEQHPSLTFEIECDEEQGWGVAYLGEHGELNVTNEWENSEEKEQLRQS
jgi:hypothetical protein